MSTHILRSIPPAVPFRGARRLLSTPPPPATEIFDRHVKLLHRERAASRRDAADVDYLRAEFARRLVDRIHDVRRDFPRVLDLGCAAGHVHTALSAAGAGGGGRVGEVVHADVAQGMLRRARAAVEGAARRYPSAPRAQEFVCVDEERVVECDALRERSFDLVTSNLVLHWVNDLPGALAQVARVLKPDGLFLGTMFGGETLRELRVSLQLAEEEVRGGVTPRVSPMVHVRDAGSVLGRGGFVLTTVDVDHVLVDYPDMETLMDHLQRMGEASAVKMRRWYLGRRAFARASEIYKERFGDGNGNVLATFQVIHLAGWAPADSQRQPLPRGSAQRRILEEHVGGNAETSLVGTTTNR